MKNKLPKNIDFASGFFSSSDLLEEKNNSIETPNEMNESQNIKTSETAETSGFGGRPQKIGLKNEQFTLTLDPQLYEKLKIIAETQTKGNFSRLIEDAVKFYCEENSIDLDDIKIDPQILEFYKQKQAKRKSNKK